jgi:hypothetical protein
VTFENYIASSKAHVDKPLVMKAIDAIDMEYKNKCNPHDGVTTRQTSVAMYKEHFTSVMAI